MDADLTVEKLLQQWTQIISAPRCSTEIKTKAIREVYEIGVIAGKLEGARIMGDQMMASIRKSPDGQPA